MLVIDRLKIARNYTSKPVFMVDAMSAFPIFVSALEFHQGRSRYQWIRILKFFRLLKLGKMIKVVRQISKLMLELILSSSRRGWIDIWQYSRFLALLKLGGLFAMIGLAMHSLACVWHLVAPKSHWEHRLLDDGGNNYEQMSRKKVYLLSYYESILILMGEQIAMEHKYEYMFTILATILFSFLLAIIFGEVAIFIATINEVPLAYGRKMARLRDFMSSGANSLPKALQDRIFTFYDYLWTKHRTLDGAMKIASFLPELTPHLATEVRLFWCKDMLRTVPFFGILPPLVVQRLVAAVEMHFYMPDDYIIVAGEIGNEMFYLKSGKLDVCRVEKTEIEITDDLTDGSARRASRRHQRISFQRPALQHHTRAPREFVKQERTASKGLPSARMGTYGRDSFDLRKPQPPRRPRASSRIQREQIVETLSQGSYFGEIALVAKCPRTVTVLVRTYAECAVIHRKDFEKMLADHPENFEQIMDMIRSKNFLAGSMKQTKCTATFDTVQEGPVVKAASVPPDAFSRSLSATSQATTCDQVKKGTMSQRVDSLEAAICNLEDILLHQVHDAPRVSLQTVLDPRHSPTNSMPTQPKSQSNIR